MIRGSNLQNANPMPSIVALVGCIALGIAMGIGRFAFTPILPMMLEEAAVSVGEGGWLASANYLGYLLGALSAVTLPFRASTIIRAGLLVIGIATFCMGSVHGLAPWLVLRALAGVGSAWVLVFASAWALGKLTAAGRSGLRGAVFAGVGAGMAVAGFVCVGLGQRSAGSRMAWQGLGVIALAGTVAIWSAFRTGHEETGKRSGRDTRPFQWGFDSVRLVLCYGVFGFGYIIPATFVPAMARVLVKDPSLFGWAWPVFGIAAALSTLVAAATTRFVGNRRLWAMSQLVMALGVSAPVVWPTIGGVLAAALLVGGTFMVVTMAGMHEAQIVGGPHSTNLMAVMTAAFATGQIAGPLLVSFTVGPDADLSHPLLIASLLLVASAGLLCCPRPSAHAREEKRLGGSSP
jgi:MFS family permease